MAGSGRKSQYRKSVTTTFLNDNYTPEDEDKIVCVLGNRGDNTFEVKLQGGDTALARLPKKFNKLIWIKTGDFIVIEDGSVLSEEELASKAQYSIKHILSKPNVKFLKTKNLWPSYLDETNAPMPISTSLGTDVRLNKDDGVMPEYEEEGDFYEEEEEEVLYDKMGNTITK